MTDPRPKAPRLRLVLAAVGVVVLAVAVTLYATRKIIAREALTGWLESKGVASEAEVEAFGLNGFTGRVTVGDPKNPDFATARAEVRYGIKGFGIEVISVKLTKPVVRARMHDGRLSVGSLDPLIEEFRKRPPQPDARKPRIEVDDGLLLLATDYGPVRLTADAVVEDGKLMSLDATTAPMRLRSEAFDLGVGAGVAHLRTKGDRVELSLDAPLADAKMAGLSARDARLRASAAAPYPDLQHRRGDGALVVRASLAGRRVVLDGQTFEDAQVSAALTGQAKGWIPDLLVTGQAVADLRAASSDVAGTKIKGLRIAATSPDFKWKRQGGDVVSATLRVSGLTDALAVSDLTLTDATATLEGPVTVDHRGAAMRLTGHAFGHGSWAGLGAPTALDSAEIVAVKRALTGFRLDAPGFAVTADRVAAHMALSQPARLTPDHGGEVRLAPHGSGWRLTSAGGGLPKVEADVDRFNLAPGGAVAHGRVKAALSIGPIQQGVFDAAGTLRMGTGVRFTGIRCASVQAARLEMGVNDIEALSGRLCPVQGEPLLTLADGNWRIAGRAEGVSARAPFLQARVAEAGGRVLMGQRRGVLYATADVTDARVEDASPSTRFNPLKMAGRAELASELWTAELALRTPADQPIATAKLRHQGPSGRGGVDIDTGLLTFAEGGLQPIQLSPLAGAVGSPAVGSARFAGGFQWTPGGATSGGVVEIPRLDFTSPVGAVKGLSGEVAFTSLAPLIAAPGQELRAESVDAFAALSGVRVSFGLGEKALTISGGEAAVGGGRVVVESLEVPLAPEQPTRGVLIFEGVQLHDMVEASVVGDRMELDAKVSGRVPFEMADGKVRIAGGTLRAIQPGRLSIDRSALTAMSADGAASAVNDPQGASTIQDLAYQAMEDLAFDTLDATVNSQADGRLGVLFHVIGKHDPPQRQVIRLSWVDILRRRFLDKKLPLPSGTGVNLTLDTTLNLDELLRDYADYRGRRSSPAVQP